MKNVSTSAQDAKMGGSASATAKNHTITIKEFKRDSFRELLLDLEIQSFWDFFHYQPTAVAVLGQYMAQNAQNPHICKQMGTFIESLNALNYFLLGVVERRETINEMDEFLLSIPIAE